MTFPKSLIKIAVAIFFVFSILILLFFSYRNNFQSSTIKQLFLPVMFKKIAIASLQCFSTTALLSVLAVESATAVSFGINDSVKKFTATDDEATLISRDVAFVNNGNTNIYIGTNQVSSNNQDPILASFTNGVRNWTTADIETTGADSRGIALLWNGNNELYAAFTTDGTQGIPNQDFRRFTSNGWLTTYGAGGGAKATVLLKIAPDTGEGIIGNGTFVSALLSNGSINTLVPTNMYFAGTDIVLEASSFFSPRRTDKTRMEQTTIIDSPFDYAIAFNNNLTQANSAVAPGWDGTAVAVPFEFKTSLGLSIGCIIWGFFAILKRKSH